MGRQRKIYHTATAEFPDDFPARLERFKIAADLSWMELARCLRVNVRTVRRWRKGTRPDAAHLLALLRLGEKMGRLDDLWQPVPPGV